jgi:hypothetical protein
VCRTEWREDAHAAVLGLRSGSYVGARISRSPTVRKDRWIDRKKEKGGRKKDR